MSYRQSTGSSSTSSTGRSSGGISPARGGAVARPARKGPSTGASRRPPASGGGILRFYTEDSPGLKIGPTVVLVLSLLFIAFVVLLHIWGKFHRST